MASSSAPSSPRRQTPRLQQLQSRPPLLSSRSIPSSPTSATASPSSYSAALVSPRRTPSMAPTSFAAPSPPPSSTASTTSSRVTASSHATPTPTPPTSGATAAGTLRVEVISARNLHAAVLGSLLKWTANTSNPYVVVTLHREEYITTTKDQTLNPTWKETGHLQVPLPSEQELLQTVGVHRTVLDTGGAHSFGDATGKLSGGKSLHVKTASGGGSGGSGSEFHACFPHLHVQVFHQTDQLDVAAHASGSPRTARRGLDKLIGEVLVPVLPCLMSSTSSHRAWYTLLSDEHPDAGQIQLALHYDVGGIEPLKHDIVRLAGFGGMEYYAKLVNANARFEVIDVFQDEVLVQYKSQENWLLSFEVHRNLLCVVRRPSMLRDAQSQLQGQIIRVRHSPLVARAHRVWQIVPATPRRQLHHLYELAVFSGGAAYTVVSKSVDTTLQQGVQAGVKSCVHGSTEAVSQVSLEALRLFWSGEDSRPKPKRPSPTEEMAWFLEGGPLSGRGKVVHAFGGDTAGAGTYHGHLDEEEKVEESGFVFTVDPEDDEDESLNARESLRNEDEEKSNEEEAAKGDLWGDDVPEQLICPITGCPMLDPVVAADGHTYEREAILQWFAGSNKSPMTGAQMETTQVFPNFTLKRMSEELQEKRRAERRRL